MAPHSGQGTAGLALAPHSGQGTADLALAPHSGQGKADLALAPHSGQGKTDLAIAPHSGQGTEDLTLSPQSRQCSTELRNEQLAWRLMSHLRENFRQNSNGAPEAISKQVNPPAPRKWDAKLLINKLSENIFPLDKFLLSGINI